ncbi:LON peptidase substrate-binding domain-containing protein [Echinicola sp. 20G]|uniref:LON peptidase substrate-binding domain-containing protein n=1 Tax=Echinicola sp. 20G TaxID=2781961 RepID=UPI0019103E10|nr:LON peptidase substrate-binding domain-containing protein [Echinicola sp. 20G]
MSLAIPLFPLKLVAFPGERLNLHIFEPRYKQLVRDCIAGELQFGICVFTDRLMSHGTMVRLVEVYKEYEDGRLDIKTEGLGVFKINTFENPLGSKLYAGGEVELLEEDNKVSGGVFKEFIFYLREMLRLMGVDASEGLENVNSFTFAHKLGLKLEEEYALIQMQRESESLIYLTNHLKKMLPIARELEKARERVKMNGHFKSLDPLDF